MFFKVGTKLSLNLALKEKFLEVKFIGCIEFTWNSLNYKYLIEICFFTVGNITLKKMLFLYFHEHQFMKELVSRKKNKAPYFHSTKRLIDGLYAINGSGEFVHTYTEIWNPEELEPKPGHHDKNPSLLNLETNILGENLVCNHLAKGIPFHFFNTRMPLIYTKKPNVFHSAFIS